MATAAMPQISEAEWEVMKVVWAHGPLTSGEIVKRLPPGNHWKPRTIKTMLGRLVRKGAVGVEEHAHLFLYRARVTREACVKQESRSFLARVFDGAVTPALLHFLEHSRLSAQDLEQLRRIVEREGRP